MCLGQAKHEPCGEHWDATYGETAWRMAVAALCLPPGRCNRARLVRVALSSALTCVGSRTDHCSEWKDKGRIQSCNGRIGNGVEFKPERNRFTIDPKSKHVDCRETEGKRQRNIRGKI